MTVWAILHKSITWTIQMNFRLHSKTYFFNNMIFLIHAYHMIFISMQLCSMEFDTQDKFIHNWYTRQIHTQLIHKTNTWPIEPRLHKNWHNLQMTHKINTIVLSTKFEAEMFPYSNTMVAFALKIYPRWFLNKSHLLIYQHRTKLFLYKR